MKTKQELYEDLIDIIGGLEVNQYCTISLEEEKEQLDELYKDYKSWLSWLNETSKYHYEVWKGEVGVLIRRTQ